MALHVFYYTYPSTARSLLLGGILSAGYIRIVVIYILSIMCYSD